MNIILDYVKYREVYKIRSVQNYTAKEFLRYKICLLLIFLLFFILALISFYPNVLTFSRCKEIEQNSRMKDESKLEKFVIRNTFFTIFLQIKIFV